MINLEFHPSSCGQFVIQVACGAYSVMTLDRAQAAVAEHLDDASRIMRMHNSGLDQDRHIHEAIAAKIEAALDQCRGVSA